MSGSLGSGLMSAFMDPGIQALGGMAQGFAQAAMPTRMPTPLGAVLGMGIGGALHGVKNSQQMQMSQQQIEQAQIGNQRAHMLLDWYKNQYGGGSPGGGISPGPGVAGSGAGGVVSAAPGGGVYSPAVAGGASPSAPGAAQGGYLVTPQSLAARGDLAMATGNDRTAATLYGMPNTMAGGPGYAMGRNGVAFAVPGGGKDPGTVAGLAAATKGGELPATLAAQGFQMGPNGTLIPIPGGQADPAYQGQIGAVKPFDVRVGGMHYDTVHGWVKNPELKTVVDANGQKSYMWMAPAAPGEGGAANGGASGAPPPDPFPSWAQRINGAENGGGAPNAQNPNSSATGNGQFLDGTWPQVIRAVRPDLTAGKTDQQLLALRSVPGLADSATQQYARQNAAILAQSGLPITGSTVYLSHFLGPAGAVKVLKAVPTTPLSMILPQQVLAANPQIQGLTAGGLVGWASNKMGPDPAAAPAPAKATGTAEPIMGPDGKPVIAAIAPQQQAGRDAAVKDFLTKDQDAYQAAQNTQAWVTQINHAADTMNASGPLSMTGPYADARLTAMSGINDMARTLGLKAPFDSGAVASWEEMRKATITAGFELSSHYEGHARQAASTIENATSAVPGMQNSPAGLKLVSAGIREAAQSAIDLHNYKQSIYDATKGAGLERAENDFYQKYPAAMYAQRAISTVHPVAITSQADLNKYLPGTYITLPNGRMSQVPMRDGAPPIPSYLQSAPVQPAPAPQ